MTAADVIAGGARWSVECGDCIESMARLPAGSVDLVFSDPPFNIVYEYDIYQDALPHEAYLEWSRTWIMAALRALKPAGTLWLAIGDEYAADLDVLCRRRLGLFRRSWVVWHYTFGVNSPKKFTPSHTHLLYYVVDPGAYTFNADAVKVPSARESVYGDKRAKAGGRLPDDVWQFPRVCGTFRERVKWHPCQMPLAVLDRVIRATSNPGELVLDPFAGSGTTLVAAETAGRRAIGFELSPEYARRIPERFAIAEMA